MFISLVIPVFNAQDYIAKCLDSITNQDFFDYEIILINDGSTDDTNRIINEYIINHQNIHIVYKIEENKGPGEARNLGISLASGEYIWFIDADDKIERHSLSKLKKTIEESRCDILRFSYRVVENEKVIRKNMEYVEDIYKGNKLLPFINESLTRSWSTSMTCWQHVYKKELIKNMSFIIDNKPYGEDILFNVLIYPKAINIQIISDILYIYNKRRDSLSRTSNHNYLFKTLNYYHIVKDFYIRNSIWDIYKEGIISSFGDFAILGGGKKKKGAIYFTYSSFDNYLEAYEYIEQIISFYKFQEFVKDALSRNVTEYLSNLYCLLEKRDVISILTIICDNSDDEDNTRTENEEDDITFLTNLDIAEIGDCNVAIPTGETSMSFIADLNKESARVLRYLIETKSIEETLKRLYKDYEHEDKKEIKENLLDFISQLKSQKIIK